MESKHLVAASIITFALLAFVSLCYAQTFTKPEVTLPVNWALSSETAYPSSASEHDPAGAALLEYENPQTGDYIVIHYEKAVTTYTNAELKAEAKGIFSRDESDLSISESGTITIAGVHAGFAKGYDSQYDVYYMEVVFVKDQYYINAFAVYQGNQQSNDAVLSLIDSLEVSSSSLGGITTYLIVGLAAVVVVAIIFVVVLRRGRKPAPAALQLHTHSGNTPPPPQTS